MHDPLCLASGLTASACVSAPCIGPRSPLYYFSLQITKLHLQCKYPALAEIYNPVPGVVEGVPSSRGYHGGFSSQLMVKDLRWGPRAPWRWLLSLLACAMQIVHCLQFDCLRPGSMSQPNSAACPCNAASS